MERGGKPVGRIDGGTMSVGDAVAETISVDETLPASSDDAGDFAELRDVARSNYDIGDEIARGGMGVILEARDRRTGRSLAIKEVRADVMARSPAAVRAAVLRFRREAVLTAQLQHPSIVPVYEIGRFGQVPFIAMKRVSGRPLDKLIDECESSADRLALLPRLIAIADALAYAHAEGVVHRDLKPANVVVGAFGETIVIDWGLAKVRGLADDTAGQSIGAAGDLETVAGSVFGTPQYMPPEQAEGREVGPPGDVYALGAILYELLTAEAPYTSDIREGKSGPTASDVIALVTERAPRPIAELNPAAPEDLVSIANKAMARDADDRYASAKELAADLGAFERGQLVEVHEYSALDLLRRWVSRHRGVVFTALVLFLLGAGSTAWFVVQTMAARDEALTQEKRASSELHRAMVVLRDRGFDEIERGNLQRAALALSTAYRHLKDYPLRVALGDVMRAIEPYERSLIRQARRAPSIDVNHQRKRLAIEVGRLTRIVGFGGDVEFEIDGLEPRFANAGENIVTRTGPSLRIWSADGNSLHTLTEPNFRAWEVSERGDVVVVVAGRSTLIGFSVSTGEELFRATEPDGLPIGGVLAVSRDGSRALITRPNNILVDTSAVATHRLISQNRASHTNVALADVGALSPDGSRAALSTTAGEVVILDASTGNLIRRFSGYERTLTVMQFSEDGRYIVSIDLDGGLCFTALAETEPDCLLHAQATSIDTLAGHVVTGHENGSVTLWDRRGRMLERLAAHEPGTTMARLYRDGAAVLTGGADGALRSWSLARGRANTIIEAAPDERLELAPPLLFRIRKDALIAARIDDLDDVTTIEVDKSGSPRVDAAGTVILAGGAVWLDGKATTTLPRLETAAASAIDPAGKLIATCQQSGLLEVTDVATRRLLWSADISGREGGASAYNFRRLLFSPSGSKLVLSTSGLDLIFDARRGAQRAELVATGAKELSTDVLFIRGETRYVSSRSTNMVLWDDSGALRTVETGTRPHLSPGPDDGLVVVGTENSIGFFGETDGGDVEWMGRGPQSESQIVAVAVSKKGLIAVASLLGRVFIYDKTGQLVATRVAQNIRRLVFAGETLIGDSRAATFLWSFAPESRDPAQVAGRIADLTGPASAGPDGR